MDDGRLLHAAILANPDDDGARLAFADWLQDQDDEQARWLGRFIAEQMSGRYSEPVLWLDKLLGKMSLEFAKYGVKVFRSPGVFDMGVCYWHGQIEPFALTAPLFHVNRGFVFHADLSCAAFMKCAGPLFARHPVTSISLDRGPINAVDGEYTWMVAKSPSHDKDAWNLPLELFDAIPWPFEDVHGHIGYSSTKVKVFRSRRDAIAALEVACMIHGKRAAADWLLTNVP